MLTGWPGGAWLMGVMACVVMVVGLVSCGPKVDDPVERKPALSRAEAESLIHRHNENASKIDVLWCRLSLELEWQDEGKRRRETGEGVLIYRAPDELALTVGKLGQDALWAGGDGQRYWMFDLREDVAWVGGQDGLGGGSGLPLPVQPRDVSRLMGWSPIASGQMARARYESVGGRLLFEPLDLWGQAFARMVFDSEIVAPVRSDVLHYDGGSAVSSRLSDPIEVAFSNGTVTLMKRVEIVVSDGSAKMSMRLRDIQTDGRKVRDAAFDLDRLMRAHKPKRVIDLDESAQP